MKSLSELAATDQALRGNEFVRYVKTLAAARFDRTAASELAQFQRAPQRVIDAITKAAVGAAGPGAGQWGSETVGYAQLAGAFLDSLRPASVFFRMLGDTALRRVPLRTRLGILTLNATAYVVAAGKARPISKMNFNNPTLDTIHAAAIIVVTDEVLQSTAPGAEASFSRALRQGVADVVDEKFLSEIAPTGASMATASPQTDLRGMLSTVNTSGAGLLYWVMSPTVANVVSTKLATNGTLLFPEMTPLGGTMLGLPALVTTTMPHVGGSPAASPKNSLWLIDASGIAANSESIEVDLARQVSLELDNAPAGDAIAPTHAQLVSLWQTDSVAIRAQVWFGAEKLQSSAVAVLDNIPSAW